MVMHHIMKLSSLIMIFCVLFTNSIITNDTCLTSEQSNCILNSNMQNYNYLMYVTQWPPTVNASYPYYIDSFTINGIWPTFNNNSYPCYCNNTNFKFNFTTIKSLYRQLEIAWYDYKGDQSTNLWTRQWEKHGTCITTNQFDFFNYGIYLHNKYDFVGLLAKKDIIPSTIHKYNYTWIYEAIKSDNAAPLIDCKIMEKPHGEKKNIVALYRITYCFDFNFKLIDCPNCMEWQHLSESKCTDKIYFLPLHR